MYKFFRPLIFKFSPETCHHAVVSMLRIVRYVPFAKWMIRKMYDYNAPSLGREVFGLHFRNPIGFAAGFDKNAEVYNELGCFGFGFVEVGSITPQPQPGNPKPRVFRLPADKALINRMGINNVGAKKATVNLKGRRSKNSIVGGNISKNSTTSNANAAADIERVFVKLYEQVDYFAINVSCPNVKDLTALQQTDSLRAIVEAVTEQRKYHDEYRPILLKLSPDLSASMIEDTLGIVFEYGLDGLIVANTTTSREGLQTPAAEIEAIGNGGLSGAPLLENTVNMVHYISTLTKKQLPIIASGGVMTEADALRLLDAGASLVQVYTGFIYNGPGFIKKILRKLVEKQDKIRN